jgi:adenine nucleotide transporter 17
MMAGALAGSATVLITNPIWVINTRMTARKTESDSPVLPGAKPAKAPSTLGTLLSLLHDEGPARLFAGVMPALVLVINPILQYTVFEQLKQALEKRRRVTPKDAFYLGALGKLLATSITYPYITVKSRMHVAGRDGPREDMFTTFRRIIREEGYMGLYGGEFFAYRKGGVCANNEQVLDQRLRRASSRRRFCSRSRMRCMRIRLLRGRGSRLGRRGRATAPDSGIQ